MQKSGTDTISDMVGLTIKSTNPLQLTNGDTLILTEDFVFFNKQIDITKLSVGDKFSAITLSGDQMFYITDVISSTNELYKSNNEIDSLKSRIGILETSVSSLESRVSALESKV